MLRGELYLADDPELGADHRRCRLLVERFNATSVTDRQQQVELLRTLLGHLGQDTEIKPPPQCDYGYPISVGARSFINYGAIILDCAPVTIGNDVQIATAVQLLTATHPLDAAVRRSRYESAKPISIADGAWLGAGVIVCPGVSIGQDTVGGTISTSASRTRTAGWPRSTRPYVCGTTSALNSGRTAHPMTWPEWPGTRPASWPGVCEGAVRCWTTHMRCSPPSGWRTDWAVGSS